MVQQKMGGWLDNNNQLHAYGSDYAEGCVAAEKRYGFDPATKSKEFMRGYRELSKQLWPLDKWASRDSDRTGYLY